jgi:Tfp pilus assembly protein PilV
MKMRAGMRGFSLVELIAIIVLLAVGLVSLLQVFGTATHTISYNVDGQLGAQLAQERVEQVLADRRNPARGYSYMAAANYPAEPAIPGFASYSRTTAFAAGGAPCAPGGTCQTVTVTVRRAGQPVGQVTLMVGGY